MAGAFLASIAIIFATTFGVGRFGDAAVPIAERVRGAQVGMMTVTIFTLVLTTLFTQRKEAEESLAKERTMLARLHEVGSRLGHTRDLRQALDEILAGAIELTGADMGAIRLWDSARGSLRIEAHRGFTCGYLDLFRQIPVESTPPCKNVLRSGERMVIEDVEQDYRFAPFRPLARAAGYRALQSTRILSREGAPLGVLGTHFRSVHKPSDQDLHLLDLYVRQAADIIEHHKAHNALCESEERLRLAQLRTGIGVWDRNLRTGKLTLTPELEAVFGLEPGNVKCYADFRALVHPHDIGPYEAERDAAVRRRATFKAEYRLIRPDGQVRWILATGGAFYDEVTGDPIRLVGNDADITERKQAELTLAERNAQLALAGRVALVGAYAYDVETEMVQISEGYVAIFSFPDGTTELPRSQWLASIHPEDREPAENLRNQVFRERWGEYNVEYRIVVPDRGVRWLEARTFISYDGNGHPRHVVGVNIDVTERKRAEEQQRILLAELDHRVKNVLATVSAVVSHTQEGSRSVASFAAALDGRIRSMATTHELLSAGRWRGISLAELVRRELAPYVTRNKAIINGPEVLLRPEAGQAIAMVLHELVTNAAKYGAFSTRNGHVAIRWDRQPNGHARSQLVLEWKEIGGPPVVATGKPSYGTSTIRDLIPYEFGGAVDLVLAPDGLSCRLELSSDWLMKEGAPASDTIASALSQRGSA
jgi:PAS domain S-box-containing protein